MNIRLIRLESLAPDRCLAEFECVPPTWLPEWESPPTWERTTPLGEEPVYRVRVEFEAKSAGGIPVISEVTPDDPAWRQQDRAFRDQYRQPSDLLGLADGSAEDVRRITRAIGVFLEAATPPPIEVEQ
jgi:hypothetical protein